MVISELRDLTEATMFLMSVEEQKYSRRIAFSRNKSQLWSLELSKSLRVSKGYHSVQGQWLDLSQSLS